MKKTTTSPATHMPEQENKTLDVDSQDFFEVAYKYRTAAPVDQDLTVKRFQELKQWIKKYGEQFQPAPTPAQEVTGVDDNRSKPAHCFAEQTGQGKENCVFPACHCGLPAQEEHKHTPGKVILHGLDICPKDKPAIATVYSDDFFYPDEVAKANAARIVECWNNYDKVKQDLYSIMNQAGMLTKIACDHEKEIENLKTENEQLKAMLDKIPGGVLALMKEIQQLTTENEQLKEQAQRKNVSIEMLLEAIKPFAELYGELSGMRIKQGGTVYQHNSKAITVEDLEKAANLITYHEHHK